MYGRARRRASSVLDDVVRVFAAAGYRPEDRRDGLSVRLSAGARPGVRLSLVPSGRIFGGTFALEIATADPVLPRTKGLSARGRGLVRWQGVRFRPSAGDELGRRLARRLEADAAVAKALSAVHFEQVRVAADGRVVIRHMGGSLVWMLFPPVARSIPLVAPQVRATIAAIDAVVRVGAADAA